MKDEYYWFICVDESMCVVRKHDGYYTFPGSSTRHTWDGLEPYGMLGEAILPPTSS